MKGNGIYLGVLTFVTFLTGCNSEHKNEFAAEPRTFTLDDFATVDLSVSAVIITSDPDIVGVVKEIRLINDSVIALSQVRSDNNVILYNLRSGEYQIANRRGSGPLELTNVGNLSVAQDSELLMTGTFDQKMISACWNQNAATGEFATIVPKLNSENLVLKSVPVDSDAYIVLPLPPHSTRLLLLNSDGAVVDSLGSFPATEMPDSIAPSNSMFQADLAFSPSVRKAVVSNKTWNEIAIHPLDGAESIILSGPIFPSLAIRSFGDNVARGYSPRPLCFIFSGVSASDTGFTVGYIGVEVKSETDFNRQIGSLLEFDWDGNPQRRFILPNEATAFDVGPNAIYTIENLPDPTLVKYKLNN